MKFLTKMKDGGPESPVVGYFLIEIKSLFSVVLLHFGGTREAFHSHAFNALTVWLRGEVIEQVKEGDFYSPRYWSAGEFKYTPRGCMHKILPCSNAWALSIRGPWSKTWQEYKADEYITLTHGRKRVA